MVGILLGIIFGIFIIGKLGNKIPIFRSLRKWILFGFIITSMNIAFKYIELNPKISGIVEKTLVFLLIIAITGISAKIIRNLIISYQEKVKDVLPSTSLFNNLTTIIIYILGILIALDSIGISITPIIATLGIGGLAIALALQDTLSNLFAGIHISVSKMIRVGDYIKLNTGEEGYVVDINWRNTIIRELANNYIMIPNSKIANSIIKNQFMPEKEIAVVIQVGVSYDSDLEKVESITIEVAKEVMREVPGGVPEFEPFIRYQTFGDFSINFSVIMRAREFTDQFIIRHEFIKRLHKRYKEEGIIIPYPTRTLKFS